MSILAVINYVNLVTHSAPKNDGKPRSEDDMSVDMSQHHLTSRKVAALCTKFIQKKLKLGNDHEAMVIPRMLMENDCDSFALSMIDDAELQNFIEKCTKNQMARGHTKQIIQELRKQTKHGGLKWCHIAHAVSNEMTVKLGQVVETVANEKLPKNADPKRTTDELMDAVRKQKIRKLVLSERKYFRDLVDRACHPMKFELLPITNKGLFRIQLTTTECRYFVNNGPYR